MKLYLLCIGKQHHSHVTHLLFLLGYFVFTDSTSHPQVRQSIFQNILRLII